jgi:outer membrane protein assembly factor BamB
MRRMWLRLALAATCLALPLVGRAEPLPAEWLTYGNDAQRTSYLAEAASPPRSIRLAWTRKLAGRITSQILVAENTLFVGTSAGTLYALELDGRRRWHVRFAQLNNTCPQLDGWGITGTGAVDRRTHALYVADAWGRLHALDLGTGRERPGWPVRLFSDFRREHVWGALSVVGGSVYLGTASYCDRAMEGKVIRVDLETRAVSRWTVVPRALGGGGGIWGWGGVAYSATRNSLLVVTGNAFRGGRNVGRRHREWAGYGERLVELAPDLRVRSASHPTDIFEPGDLDFVGSPVVFTPAGCPELVAATNKNGRVYVWWASAIRSGPQSSLGLIALDAPALLTQPAFYPQTRSLYVVSHSRLVRIGIGPRCRARFEWSRGIGNGLLNSSPTIARDTVWFTRSGNPNMLIGADANGGAPRIRTRLRDSAFAAPTVLGGRVYVGSFGGRVYAFELRP